MIRKSGHRFSERSCSNKKIERDDGSQKRYPVRELCLLARGRSGRPQPSLPGSASLPTLPQTGRMMTDAKYDVLGIGNAIFDVLAQNDEAGAAAIYKDMGPATEMSGGSAANTIVGIAGLGARTAYIGKVKADQIGGLYTHAT